ncbi:MAG: hypothetical protein ACK56F_05485, partial [bacterium]
PIAEAHQRRAGPDERAHQAQGDQLVAVQVQQHAQQREHRHQAQRQAQDGVDQLQHLQREHPLVSRAAAAAKAGGIAQRQRHVVPVQHAEAQVPLRADGRVVAALLRRSRIGPQPCGEDRAAQPGGVGAGRAHEI